MAAPPPPNENNVKNRTPRHENRLSKGESDAVSSPTSSNCHQVNGDDRRLTADFNHLRIETQQQQQQNDNELDRNLRNDMNRQNRRSDPTLHQQMSSSHPHSPPGSKSPPTRTSTTLNNVVLPIVSEVSR